MAQLIPDPLGGCACWRRVIKKINPQCFASSFWGCPPSLTGGAVKSFLMYPCAQPGCHVAIAMPSEELSPPHPALPGIFLKAERSLKPLAESSAMATDTVPIPVFRKQEGAPHSQTPTLSLFPWALPIHTEGCSLPISPAVSLQRQLPPIPVQWKLSAARPCSHILSFW